jgi:pilus assembly protein CpaB
MGRRLLAIGLAALIAVIGVASVFLYARGADARAVAGQQAADVYVAQQLVPSGTVLKDAVRTGLIVKTRVPAKALPAGALTAVGNDNSGLLALGDIQAGEYVQAGRFGTTPTGTKAIEVPAGQVAVSVQLADAARVGTFVTPGSRVVLFDTFAASSNGDETKQTRVLLDDVLVIAMGDTSLTPVKSENGESGGASGNAGALVTVAVTPADSVRLIHGIQTGQLYAALRGSDAKIDLTTSVSDQTLFAAK